MPANFWQKLKKTGQPILALAPMAGFSDAAFRQICRSYGADVLYSEMISAAALFYNRRLQNNKTLALIAFNAVLIACVVAGWFFGMAMPYSSVVICSARTAMSG